MNIIHTINKKKKNQDDDDIMPWVTFLNDLTGDLRVKNKKNLDYFKIGKKS